MNIPNLPEHIFNKNKNMFYKHGDNVVKRKNINNQYEYFIITKCKRCGEECLQNKGNSKRCPGFCSFDCKFMYELKQYDIKSYNMMNFINNDNFYYLIGLICSDGYIKYRNGYKNNISSRCEIGLNKKDINLLKKIQETFGGCISDKYCKYVIYNRDFVNYLKNIVGIKRNKTYNLNITKWFDGLADNFKMSFMHGVIDGDGCVFFKKYKHMTNRTIYITTASFKFANMIKKYLNKTCKTFLYKGFNIKKSTVPYYNIGVAGYECRKLKQIFDTNQEICLKRKLDTFKLL